MQTRIQVGGPLDGAEVAVEIFRPDWSLLSEGDQLDLVVKSLTEATLKAVQRRENKKAARVNTRPAGAR